MKNLFKILLTFIFIFSTFRGYSQNIHIKSKIENIEVKEDSSFTKEITIKFNNSNESIIYPIFYDTELEKVFNIQLFVKKGKRLKKISLGKIYEEKVELDYIASKKIKSVKIPKDKEVILKYSIECKELMYFSSLQFFSYNKIDTLKYQLKIPEKFELVYNTTYKDSLDFYSVDSLKTDSNLIWNIKVTPKKVDYDPLQYFGIYKNMKVPLMRTLVLPNTYKNKPLKYMNDWYYNSIAPKKGLSAAVKIKIDELTANIKDKKQIIDIIYSYVQKNFKYVAIEIGMGAFIPSHVNEVFSNKQGDCKDLSNFLSEVLKYKGIESDIALASTFDHINNCDFPSLSSANHVICVAYLNEKSILLDPTDQIHIQGTPVQSLQGRTILIINSDGGQFYDAVPFSPQKNEISYQMDLKINSKEMLISGFFDIKYHGISDNYLQRNLSYGSKKDFKNFAIQHYENIFGNQSISNLEITNNSKKLNFKGNISINGKTFNDGLNKYLFIDFLPRLIETENRETLIEGIYLNNPFYKKLRVKISADEPIEPFKTKEYIYKEKGVSLILKVKAVSNIEIECEYDFMLNYIFIEKSNLEITNKILKSFKKIKNEPIVLKKEKS